MANVKLTKRLIDSFQYEGDGKSQDVRWDSEMRGFGVRIYPSGKKSFIIIYRHEGRQRFFTVGRYGQITLEEARDLARKAFGKVADDKDVLEMRQTARKKDGLTVKKAFKDFLERYAKQRNKQWKETERIFEYDVLPLFGNKPLAEVRKRDIIQLLDTVMDRGKPIMANRTLAAVRKFFNWCVERDMLQFSPVHGISAPARAKSRDRVLANYELAEVWRAAETINYPFGPLVQFMILTGQRRSETAAAKWEHIDLDTQTWKLPKENTKSKRDHYVHLSPLAISILKKCNKFLQGEYVFSSSGLKPFENFTRGRSELDSAINTARAEKGFKPLKNWNIHDLRRTLSSGLAALGIEQHVTERLLAHRSGIISGVAAVYNRYDYGPETQEALDRWAERVLEIVEEYPEPWGLSKFPTGRS